MKYLIIFAFFFSSSCTQGIDQSKGLKADVSNTKKVIFQDSLKKIVKSDEEWKKELSETEYYILREAGTERPFTGDLLKNKENGVYTCRACGFELFSSDTKFKSGTGWPSFYAPIVKGNVSEDVDYNIGYKRTEILCARCDGHLGHVFNDGPKPTGLRYCVNSVSLDFVPKTKEDKE